MANHSAGILLYRFKEDVLEILLVHPGGPFYAKKDDGAWSIPKGLIEDSEDVLAAAKREFTEETGFEVDGDFIELGSLIQPSKKTVTAFALNHDLDAAKAASNTFELEWPPRSGKKILCPEVDKAEWFPVQKAMVKILKGQSEFITKLSSMLNYTMQNEPAQRNVSGGQISLFDS
jgi:predicted NUDIX family NTP pyrophosphohydrolase